MFTLYINDFDYKYYNSTDIDIGKFYKENHYKNKAFIIGHNIIDSLIEKGYTREKACEMLNTGIYRRKIELELMMYQLLTTNNF